ncbi:MAG: 2-hydroxyacyl-CoA dehydratase [Deltaproteobacteria bacterium]|nr:2-hydroxyacyl-CoA dehydratase [Deltaproteobacteria bacterium]
MNPTNGKLIGFACGYTPLPLIHAAGYTPYRILPTTAAPDQAGQVLHENLCPHVKRILDRALSGDLPELEGVVFINCCDAMRRLADAYGRVRPQDKTILLNLPVTTDEPAAFFFNQQITQLLHVLEEWSGRAVSPDGIEDSIQQYQQLARSLDELRGRVKRGSIPGGSKHMQAIYNQAATGPIELTLTQVRQLLAEPEQPDPIDGRVPVYLFGNVLPDIEAFALFESCGARIVGENLCTGSRLFRSWVSEDSTDVLLRLARGILSRPHCPRTIDLKRPMGISREIKAEAELSGARGVVGHIMKFCDPYLYRIPTIREHLRLVNLPLLVLDGDCTMRSFGQHRTRVEAFIEMLR